MHRFLKINKHGTCSPPRHRASTSTTTNCKKSGARVEQSLSHNGQQAPAKPTWTGGTYVVQSGWSPERKKLTSQAGWIVGASDNATKSDTLLYWRWFELAAEWATQCGQWEEERDTLAMTVNLPCTPPTTAAISNSTGMMATSTARVTLLSLNHLTLPGQLTSPVGTPLADFKIIPGKKLFDFRNIWLPVILALIALTEIDNKLKLVWYLRLISSSPALFYQTQFPWV